MQIYANEFLPGLGSSSSCPRPRRTRTANLVSSCCQVGSPIGSELVMYKLNSPSIHYGLYTLINQYLLIYIICLSQPLVLTFMRGIGTAGFVEPTLCTTSTVQRYTVHHRPALCTMHKHHQKCWLSRCGFVLIRWCTWHFFMYTMSHHLHGAQCDVV